MDIEQPDIATWLFYIYFSFFGDIFAFTSTTAIIH